MSYKCPLGRLPTRPVKYKPYNSDIIPESIKLPDGREFRVADLTKKVKNKQFYNLLTVKKEVTRGAQAKYSFGDKLWISNQTPKVVAEKYNVTVASARQMISNYKKQLSTGLDQSHPIVYSDE